MRDVPERPTRLTFAGGGWVLLLAALVTAGLVLWAVAPALLRPGSLPPGDGKRVESYGFDLSHLALPRDQVIAVMPHRDAVTPIDEPTVLEGERVAELYRGRRKYLVPDERVVGVVVDGEARAYPISVLTVHEVVHDVLGGRPIAVTYHWPCDSVVVFDRVLEDGRVLAFGVSGLLGNGNQLLHARHLGDESIGGESLWSQLLGRAVSGADAAAGARLRRMPAQLVTWRTWLALHPESTVIDRRPGMLRKRYTKADPDFYFASKRVVFPAEPAPPADGPPAFTRVLAFDAGGARRVYPLPLIVERAGADGTWTDRLGTATIVFAPEPDGTMAAWTCSDAAAIAVPALWFAWHAMHPEDELAR